jgi:hypothetical protein
MAGIMHASTLLVILMVAAPLASFVPMAVLAAILFVVSYNMGDWEEIPELLKLSRLEIGTWLITFGLTVFADLTVAVEAGMILAALVFIRKVTFTTKVSRITSDRIELDRAHILQDKLIPPYVAVFRILGPFLFGATDKLDEIARQLPTLPPIVILRLRHMTAIDSTGILALENFADQVHASSRAACGAGKYLREHHQGSGTGQADPRRSGRNRRSYRDRLEQFVAGEEVADFKRGGFGGIGTMRAVVLDARAEVTADASRRRFGGIGGAHRLAPERNGIVRLQHQDDDPARTHELREVLEESPLAMHGVKAFGLDLGEPNGLDGANGEAGSLNASDDIRRDASRDGVGLDDGERSFDSQESLRDFDYFAAALPSTAATV